MEGPSTKSSGSTTRNNKELENIRACEAHIEANSKQMAASVNDSVRRLRVWARSIIDLDQKMSEDHLVGINRLQDASEAEKQMEQMARDKASQQEAEVARVREAYRSTLIGVKDLREKRRAVPEETQLLKSKLASREDRLHAQKSHARKRIAQTKTDLNAEFENIKRLQTILGMNVHAVEDFTLMISFKEIDRRNPDRPFKVKVYRKNEQVETRECEPLVHNYEELSASLSEGEISLKTFLHELRQAFVDCCQ